MQYQNQQKLPVPTAIWAIALVCMAAVIFSICGGAAYAGVQEARMQAAQAGCGHVEAVLFLAENVAGQNGLGAPPGAFSDLLKSYDSAPSAALTPYERYVLAAMLEHFGPARSFDFAITRFQNSTGAHTQIYLFPTPGRTDIRRDRYYLMSDGAVTEYNG